MKKRNEKKEVILTCIVIKRSLIILLFNIEIQLRVDKRITLAQLKEELVPLIGVPSTGFRVYGIRYGEEDELEGLDETLKGIGIESGSKVHVVYCVNDLIHFSFPLYPL